MQYSKLNVYAAYYCDENIRMSSSSGGIFTILAKHILSLQGSVYGVAMTGDCMGAEFIRVTHENDLNKLRGSKYFQAKVGGTYKSVKEDLEHGQAVLFSGTGCQVNGLKSYLQKDYDNLLCVDVICHGVPSPALWRKYAIYREEQMGGKLESIDFRCKDRSWADFGMKMIDTNHKDVFISKDKDSFMRMFLQNYSLRPSCYECMAKKIKMADITIGDFWGIETVALEMCDGKGTSIVLVRTEKGNRIFDAIQTYLKLKKVSYAEGVKGNLAEYSSVSKPPERDSFFYDMNSLSYDVLEKKYCKKEKKINIIKHFIKKCIKKIIPHKIYKKFHGVG